MVYYVCPNCGHRSDEYKQSMVHYNSCDVVRVRTVNSPPSSSFVPGSDPHMFQQGVAGVASNHVPNGGGAAGASTLGSAPEGGQSAEK